MIVFKINVNVKYIAHIQVHILPIVSNRVFSPHFGLGRSRHFTCHP